MTCNSKALGLLIISASLYACSKTSDPSPAPPVTPPVTPPIIQPVDPTTAKSIGFFLDGWQGKTFTVPSYNAVAAPTATATATITIDASNVITKVPQYIYGNNTNTYMGQMITDAPLLGYIKDLAPHILRFPGGNISSVYFWNAAPNNKPPDAPDSLYDSNGNLIPSGYWYGQNTANWTLSLDNYYAMLQQTNNTGIITINYSYARYGKGTAPVQTAARLAADWVRYDKGKTKFWEIGNESDGPWQAGYQINTVTNQDGQPKIITGSLYGTHFKVFADSMRKAATEVGSNIKIGAQLIGTDPTNSWNVTDRTWNNGYFASAGDYADFYIVHDYYTPSGQNSTAAVILNSAVTETATVMNWMKTTTTQGGVPLKPIALTEWNIFAQGSMQQVSHVAGMHAVLVLGELLKNQFGQASRWDLANSWANGDDQGMFNNNDEPGAPARNPRPAFYHMYYFQQYFGDRMVGSSVQQTGNNIAAYASTFTSGQASVIIVNTGTTAQTANISLQNFTTGINYYWYALTGGSDNGEFSRQVYVNGTGPSGVSGGPLNYASLKPNGALTSTGIKVSLPARSVVFLAVDKK